MKFIQSSFNFLETRECDVQIKEEKLPCFMTKILTMCQNYHLLQVVWGNQVTFRHEWIHLSRMFIKRWIRQVFFSLGDGIHVTDVPCREGKRELKELTERNQHSDRYEIARNIKKKHWNIKTRRSCFNNNFIKWLWLLSDCLACPRLDDDKSCFQHLRINIQ